MPQINQVLQGLEDWKESVGTDLADSPPIDQHSSQIIFDIVTGQKGFKAVDP